MDAITACKCAWCQFKLVRAWIPKGYPNDLAKLISRICYYTNATARDRNYALVPDKTVSCLQFMSDAIDQAARDECFGKMIIALSVYFTTNKYEYKVRRSHVAENRHMRDTRIAIIKSTKNNPSLIRIGVWVYCYKIVNIPNIPIADTTFTISRNDIQLYIKCGDEIFAGALLNI